jgi:hypothetical protein
MTIGDVVGQILRIEPATRKFDKLRNYIDNQVRPEISAAVEAVNARDPAGASAHLKGLTRLFEDGEEQFAREFFHTPIAECERVAEFERAQFRRLKAVLPMLDDQVKFDREHPGELSHELSGERNTRVAAWNTKVNAYNAGLSDLPDLVKKCLNVLRGPRMTILSDSCHREIPAR